MSGPPYSTLLSPLSIGSLEIPNRIVFGAHVTNLGQGNRFGASHTAYYLARARGGVGMLVLEAATVHPLDQPYEHIPFAFGDAATLQLATMVNQLKQAAPGMVCLGALTHSGGQSSGKILRQSPWAPSAFPEVASKRISREMTVAQIQEVSAAFAASALRLQQAGLDGVEFNAGQFSLARQFLSPLTNFRGDLYGGGLENRARFLRNTVAAIRGTISADFILGIRLCGDELAPWGGLNLADAVAVAGMLVAQGGVDYLSIQIGGPFSAHMTEAGMPMTQGHAAHLAAGVRAQLAAGVPAHGAVGVPTHGAAGVPAHGAGPIPVFAEGRIESPQLAEELLAQGQADALVMTRALISDPLLPEKCARPAGAPLRPHIAMMRYFSVQGDWNRPIGDLANPRAGREAELPPDRPIDGAAGAGNSASLNPASLNSASLNSASRNTAPRNTVPRNTVPRAMLVIGGGPAGCEAPATLAQQGHQVSLLEAGDRLGGLAARLATQIEAREEFSRLCGFYEAHLANLGVSIELNRRVTRFEPEWADFDTIYLVTGARAAGFELSVAGAAGVDIPVFSPRELLEQSPAELPQAHRFACVVDREYGFRMAAAVEWLLRHGWRVAVISPDFLVGRELVESAEFLWFNRVAAQGAVFHPRTEALSLRDGSLRCQDRFSRREVAFGPLDLVVECAQEIPEDTLAPILSAHHSRVITLGDARAPRLMGEAISHAYRTVLETAGGLK